MTDFLKNLAMRWQFNGARPEAARLQDRTGWLLTLNLRARLAACLIFLMFLSGFVGVMLVQVLDPQPMRQFGLLAVGYGIINLLTVYYLLFTFLYRVEVDEVGLTLHRFLLRSRTIHWADVVSFDYQTGDELLKICSQDKSKVSLYLSLNGLSAIRRCIATFCDWDLLQGSWQITDPVLIAEIPSWRCNASDLEGNPFDPLSRGEIQQVAETQEY